MISDRVDLLQTAVFYGADYNPEQWSPAVWQEDVRLMREAGVNLVTLGVFSWAKLEPRPGHYDFGWFDTIIALLHENNIGLCLATATASPPPWLAKSDPQSLPVTAEGTTLWPGARQAYCPHSSAYRRGAADLVRRLASRYGRHPALKIWHINNEYACHVPACFCDVSAAAFREWLQKRYRTLEALNDAWGTAFWSQQYGAWDEIVPPRSAPSFTNPTQQLDWRRFSSDSLLALMEMEKQILRELTPEVPVTTNFMGNFKSLDYWKWARREDIVSVDMYPDPAEETAGLNMALNADFMRSLGGGRPWMLMEQTPSAVNWRAHNQPKLPGQMRLWSYQALARGANAIMYFQWRASRAGAEKFHGALVPHGGTNTSRVWQEVKQLGQELTGLAEILPARAQSETAILFDWQNWWALELDSHPSAAVRLTDLVAAHYAPLYRQNITVAFAAPDSDLSAYKLLIVPNLYLVTEAGASAVARFVEQGGIALISFFSGIVDENDHIWLGGYPAPFRDLLGLWIEEFAPLLPDEQVAVGFDDGHQATGTIWSEVIHLQGAQALARFSSGFAVGKTAVARHAYGRGAAYYVGTHLAPADLARLYERITADAGVRPAFAAPDGVEAVWRRGESDAYLFLLNHRDEPVTVALGELAGRDLLRDEAVSGSAELEPFGARILRRQSR